MEVGQGPNWGSSAKEKKTVFFYRVSFSEYSSMFTAVCWPVHSVPLHFSWYVKCCIHVRCVPCHHGTARSQVADGGDGLQVWRVAENIVTCRPISRQRPKYAQATREPGRKRCFLCGPHIYPLLGNGPINRHFDNREAVFSVGSCRGIVRGHWKSTKGAQGVQGSTTELSAGGSAVER
jgi:hypothetical protein